MLFAKFMPTRWSVYSNDGACDEFVDSPVRKLPYALVTVFLALAHLGLAWLSYLLLSGGPQITPVFFEAGLDLVAILLYGPRYWPVLFAAYFGNSLWRHLGWTPALVVALAGLFRTLLSAWLFRRLAGMKKSLREFAELVALGVSATVAPCLAAGLGTPLLILAGRFPASRGALIFSQWCIADSLGILTLVPVLIAGARLCTKDRPEFDKLQVFKLLLYACGVSLVCYIIFFRPLASTFLFLVFVLILIGAAWLGPTAARASAFIVAAACMWATHAGTGGFVGGTLWENLQNLDLFLAAIALTGMAVGTFRATGSFLLPSGVLLAGWALSGWLYASLDRDRVSYDEARLDKVITSIETRIDSHFKTYEDVLSGAAGMLATSRRISPKDWHTYVSHLHLLERYPSVASISVSKRCRTRN